MCLKSKEEFTLLTATKNIICFKSGTWLNFKLKAEHNYFFYKKWKTTAKETINPHNYGDLSEINRGYHSCINSIIVDDAKANHVFLIPKGVIYTIGGVNSYKKDGYVSEQIIWLGHKFNPLTWLLYFAKYYKR